MYDTEYYSVGSGGESSLWSPSSLEEGGSSDGYGDEDEYDDGYSEHESELTVKERTPVSKDDLASLKAATKRIRKSYDAMRAAASTARLADARQAAARREKAKKKSKGKKGKKQASGTGSDEYSGVELPEKGNTSPSLVPPGCDGGEHLLYPEDAELPLYGSHTYLNANAGYPNPPEKYDLDAYAIEYGDSSRFKIKWDNLIGSGGYGEVYLAKDTQDSGSPSVVAKVVRVEKATHPDLIKREISMLKAVQGLPNIVQLLDVVKMTSSRRHEFGSDTVLIFERVSSPSYRDLFRSLSPRDASVYLYKLFEALNATHSAGIVHRDIKCANVLFDPAASQLRLIDWGLASYYLPNVPATKWAGTRRWKAPEAFVHYPFVDYASDMWSAGCIMAVLILQCNVFRQHETNIDHMINIVQFLGSKAYAQWLEKYSITKPKWSLDTLASAADVELPQKRYGWHKLVRTQRVLEMATPLALDLIDRLLVFDHELRFSAAQALNHPYFDAIRPEMEAERKRASKARSRKTGTSSGCCACCASSKPPGAPTASNKSKSKSNKSGRKRNGGDAAADDPVCTLAEVDPVDHRARQKIVLERSKGKGKAKGKGKGKGKGKAKTKDLTEEQETISRRYAMYGAGPPSSDDDDDDASFMASFSSTLTSTSSSSSDSEDDDVFGQRPVGPGSRTLQMSEYRYGVSLPSPRQHRPRPHHRQPASPDSHRASVNAARLSSGKGRYARAQAAHRL